MRIHTVTDDDTLHKIAQLSQQCFAGNPAEQFRFTQLQALARDHSVYAAFDDDAVCGYAVVLRMGDDCECISLAVDRARRKQGVASALLQDILQATAGDCYVMVRARNQAAISLYRRLGFVHQGTQPHAYSMPQDDGLHFRARGRAP